VRPGDNFIPKLDYMFEKVDVNGENEIPLYTFLKGKCGPTFTQFSKTSSLFYEPLRVGDIGWNFEKFLIDKDGRPHTRWHPHVTNASAMAVDIQTVMNSPSAFDAVEREEQMQERERRNLDWEITETV